MCGPGLAPRDGTICEQCDGMRWVPNMRTARLVTVLEVVVLEGSGDGRADPARLVTYYFTPDGKPLTVDDDVIHGPVGMGKDGIFPGEREYA